MSVRSSLYPKSIAVSSTLSDLVESAESCSIEMSQLSDTIGEELEGAVADVLGENVPPVCCRLANRIPTAGAETVNAILELAFSEEFRKCDRLLFLLFAVHSSRICVYGTIVSAVGR